MRSLAGIMLILTLTVPFVGAWQFFSTQFKLARQEAKAMMDRAYPETLNVYFEFNKIESQTLLRWEHDSEFEYRGEMYDVLRKEVIDGKIRYWCYWDRKETVLKNEFRDFLVNAFSGHARDQKSEMHFSIFLKTLFSNSVPIPHPASYNPSEAELTNWIHTKIAGVYIAPFPDPPESTHLIG